MLKVCQIFIIIFHPAHLLHNLLVLLVFLLQHVVHLIPKPPCRAQPNWTVDTLLSLSLPSYPPASPSPRPPCLPSQARRPLLFQTFSPSSLSEKKAFRKQKRYYLRLVHCRATSANPVYSPVLARWPISFYWPPNSVYSPLLARWPISFYWPPVPVANKHFPRKIHV